MKGFFRLIVLFLIISCFSSCVRSIYMDAGERAVVVECVLTDSLTQKLRLAFTQGVSQDVPTPLTDAVATLYDLTASSEAGRFVYQKDGLWTLDYAAVQGHDYRLEVKVHGYDLIYAESKMPTFSRITSTWGYIPFADSLYQHAQTWEFFSFSDPVWIYGRCYKKSGEESIIEGICTNLPMVNPFTLTGSTYVTPSKTMSGDETYYLYPSLEGEKVYDRYLHIPAGSNPVDDFLISFTDHLDYHSFVLSFNAVSESYDRYLQELIYYTDPGESKDLSAIYLREDFYTNVVGGTGVFGAKVSRLGSWVLDFSKISTERPVGTVIWYLE